MAIESHGAAPSAAAEPNRMRDLLRQATVEIRQLRAQLEAVERQVTPRTAEPIAIIGMACRYPGGADTPEAYWRLLENGVDAIGEVPSRAWDIDRYHDPDPTRPGTMYVRHGGFLDQVDQFDPQFFGIAPREADRMDPQQRLLLEVTHEALEHAGLPAFDLRGSATGVFVGVCFDDYAQRSVRSGDPTRIDAHSSLGTNRSIAAGRIAYVFGLQGPTLQLDTTCSSSLLAVHLACQSLRDGEATLALAGGVNLMLSPEATIGFCRLGALAPDGRCRTFDAAAQGYARGEGCGIVVLKKLSAALADGDRVLAVVRGSAVNHDGASNGLTAPSGPAQTAVIRAALQRAGLQPADVQYVEAHGTATPLGDPIEVMALNDVFAGRATPLLIGSVKTNFGHLEGAAGVAGLMKLVLSLQHRQIPAHLHFATPSPRIPWARLPFTVPTALTEWPATAGPRRGGVSSFGMSGTNVHLIVEEAPPSRPAVSATVDRPLHVLAVSARSPAALAEQVARYRDALGEDGVALADLCFSANTGRSHFALRRAWVAADGAGLRDQLDRAAATPSTEVGHRAAPRIAFLFTGQGAQYVQMGRALYERAPVFRDAIDRCAAIVDPMLQRPLRSVLYPDGTVAASADIDATVFTQPALFALQYALTALWRSWGVAPQIVVGHSVGEYAAAVEAGIVDLPQALGLLAARARLMHALPTAGGMAAVRASREDLAALLPESVEIAACNGPAHTVIAGPSAALGAALNALEARGLPTTRLAVSHGFHSALMAPMQPAFRRHADAVRFGAARIDFISSMTGGLAGAEAAAAGYWVDQIRQPVAFMDAMATLDALARLRRLHRDRTAAGAAGAGRRVVSAAADGCGCRVCVPAVRVAAAQRPIGNAC
ncbi:MAG: type I polyketide synthase [Burkholderiales bacterium]|nr:type I polyketide synthase [Burkholderiales bacterium]